MKRKIFAFLLIVFIPLSSVAQSIDTKQHPPGMKWQRIDTPHFRLIFPKVLTSEAQRVANILEHIYEPITRTLNVHMRPYTVLLTNQGTESNGYVALSPRRSEFYHVPPQQGLFGTGEWYALLASHEARHMAQFDKTNRDFTKAARVLFGQNGQLALTLFSVPLWFLEGDAVAMETVLTEYGRGRSPKFDMEIRTLLLSGRRYSYHKAYQRSYKHRYPNHYCLGYHMVTHVRRVYGPDTWSSVLNRTSRFSLIPLWFSRSLKKETGKNASRIYEETMDELEILWREQHTDVNLTEARIITSRHKRVWTNYQHPYHLPDGSVIALKYGMADPSTLVRIYPDGREKKISTISAASSISVGGNRVAWTDVSSDLRWRNRQYGVIMVYDIKTGRTKRLTKRTKFFTAALSPQGDRIAAVEFTPERICTLVILDAETGREAERLPNPENDFITEPFWSPDGTKIVYARQKMHGKTITVVDLEGGRTKDIIPESREDITSPRFFQNYLLYSSPYSGIDNIYAIDRESGQRYQVTSRRFGAFQPAVSPDGNRLAFVDYTVDGYDIAEVELDPSRWKKIEDIEDRSVRYYEPLIGQEQKESILDEEDIPTHTYEVKKYRSIQHIFNVHSWSILPSLSVTSNDLLNTTTLHAEFGYSLIQNVFNGGLNISYAGLSPIFDLGVRYDGRAQTYEDQNGNDIRDTWNESSVLFGFRVPFDLSRGVYSSSLSLGAQSGVTYVWGKESPGSQDELDNGYLYPLSYELSYTRSRTSSIRDINPVWGKSLRLSFSHTPLGGDYRGMMFSTRFLQYLPGFFRHHSLSIEGAYEWQGPDNYRFKSRLPFARGYGYTYHETLYKGAANYTLPLLYPDAALGGFLYLKRLSTNLFYDLGVGQDGESLTYYPSIGDELIAEFHLFSLVFPLEAGVRFSYRIRDDKYAIEPLFGFLGEF